MKKNVHIIWYIIMFMIIFLQSCSDRIVDTPDISEKEMVPVVLDISGITPANTYSTDYGNETNVGGTAAENRVDNICVYIFDSSNNCEEVLVGSSSPVGPKFVTTGIKQILAVVNGPSVISGLPTTPAAVGNFNDFRKRLTDIASLPLSPFLMVGEKLNYPLTTQSTIANPTHISINLERACAKVTMQISKKNSASPHDIQITGITLNQGANSIYLFDEPNPNPVFYTVSGTKTYSPTLSVTAFPTYLTILDTFYTYAANVGNDKTKAVYFEIKSQVNAPANIRTAKFYLAQYEPASGDTVYDIRRNYWYDVKVDIGSVGFDSIKVKIISSPWNVADTQKVGWGSGYEVNTSIPFKLVKPYVASELSGTNAKFAAIDSHSKGASWIDLKVTPEVEWELSFKSGAPENNGAMMSKDGFNTVTTSLDSVGKSNGDSTRIYIYRPYIENAEPDKGPSLSLYIGGQYVRDFVVQPRDTVPLPTNSFIMRPKLTGSPVNETRAYIPLAGVYKYWEDYLLANGEQIPSGIVTAELLWQDRPGNVIDPNSLKIIDAAKRDSSYLYAEAGAVQGNAVVAMKVGGVIYWSFHLWVTEYNPEEAAGQKRNPTTGVIFMDRNLGALTNKYDDAGDVRGLYYQYGRKDPFPKGANWGPGILWYANPSVAASTSLTTAVQVAASSSIRPKSAIPQVLNYPSVLSSSASPWSISTETNNNLWKTAGGNKTVFDPCPKGWRIPTQTGNSLSLTVWNGQSFNYSNAGVYKDGFYDTNIGYYPLAGGMNSGSTFTEVSTVGYYWTNYNDATNGSALMFNTTPSVSVSTTTSNYIAKSVRCVKDN